MMTRLSAKLVGAGHTVMRLNHRGVGDGIGRARKIYNAGCSGDMLAALIFVSRHLPNSRISCIGLSLSGNILLRLLGRIGSGTDALPSEVRERFASGFALSPVLDAETSVRRMPLTCFGIFDQYYVRRLKKQIHARHALFPDLGPPNLDRVRTLMDLDDQYTAPSIGYRSAMEYYRQTSAVLCLSAIDLPVEVVVSVDDPIDHTDFSQLKLSPSTRLHLLERGGHLGFFGDRVGEFGDRFWLEDWLVCRLSSEL
jgi:predicted alpha/beta-fold hydrolase